MQITHPSLLVQSNLVTTSLKRELKLDLFVLFRIAQFYRFLTEH